MNKFLTILTFLMTLAVESRADLNGTCGGNGDNAIWTLNETTGLLTISGKGPIEDYDYENIISPFMGNVSIRKVVIEEGITSIGYLTFGGCTELTSVSIPSSVKSIGGYAFSGCTNMKEVHITNIAAWCDIQFDEWYSNPIYYAHSLYLNGKHVEDLVIPESVTEIGDYAFYTCTGLKSITIPSSVTTIGRDAVYGCDSLREVTVLTDRPYAIDEYTFSEEVYENATLKVRKGLMLYFATAEGWEQFVRIVEEADAPAESARITLYASDNGSVEVHGKVVSDRSESFLFEAHSDHVITAIPDAGRKVKCLLVDGINKTDELIDNKYTLNNVTGCKNSVVVIFTDVDINDDGNVNSTDVVAVYNYILNGK